MKAVVIGESSGASMETIMGVYPRHKAVVEVYKGRGEVVGIGPFADRGNMAIFRSREAAEAFVKEDPFILEGLVKSYVIRDWNDTMLSEANLTALKGLPMKARPLFAALLLTTAIASPVAHAQAPAPAAVPEIPFESVPDFLKLPAGFNFGEVPGVAVDSKGRIYVFSRSGSASGPAFGTTAAQLLQFGPKGEFIQEIGKELYGWAFAHSVRIDKDDNIWAIDKGSDMIVRMNQAGRVVWVFGRRQESADGAEPWEHVNPPLAPVDGRFRQPTDIAWDSQGNSYITDGYVNSRVAKFDRNGDWVMSWGEPGTGPGQFRLPHAIVIDRNDNIYVGDRTNQRVQVFDTNGKYLREWKVVVPPDFTTRAVNGPTPKAGDMSGVGAPNSLCITPGPAQVIFLGESTWPGRVFKLSLDGKVLGVIGRSGRNLKQFSGAHAIACPSESEIYVAETSNWRVQKLLLRSGARSQ